MLDSLRSEVPAHEMGVALAALIYLRWADFQEAELEAIAAFDEADYEPVLPTGLHWRAWHELPLKQLQGFFGKQLSQALGSMAGDFESIATIPMVAFHPHRNAIAIFP